MAKKEKKITENPKVTKEENLLKKMSRAELLELLIMQTKRAEELEAALNETKLKLEQREITIRNAGSIAKAAMELNGVFVAADKAAQQYLLSIKALSGDADEVNQLIDREAQKKAKLMLKKALESGKIAALEKQVDFTMQVQEEQTVKPASKPSPAQSVKPEQATPAIPVRSAQPTKPEQPVDLAQKVNSRTPKQAFDDFVDFDSQVDVAKILGGK